MRAREWISFCDRTTVAGLVMWGNVAIMTI